MRTFTYDDIRTLCVAYDADNERNEEEKLKEAKTLFAQEIAARIIEDGLIEWQEITREVPPFKVYRGIVRIVKPASIYK